MNSLSAIGFSSFFQSQLREGELPARVVAVHRGGASLVCSERRLTVTLAEAAAGDWVALGPAPRLLERRTSLLRKRPGRSSDAQVLAANVDVAWLVTAVGPDLSLSRLERYLAMAWDGGVSPVVVVNKIDRGADEGLDEIEAVAPVYRISAKTGEGLDALIASVEPGQTVAMLGSSGVGKSTLLNALLADRVTGTNDVRESDDKGRHTTTHRELFAVGGWVLVDTPGLREVGLVGGEAGLAAVFESVEALAECCRFRDCKHVGEPGCAVVTGVDPERLARYHALVKEQRAAEDRADAQAQKRAGKRMGRMIREAKDWRRKRRGDE